MLLSWVWAFVNFLLREPWHPNHTGMFGLPGVLGMVVETVLGTIVGAWLILGAWRRTIWGAPPGGQREHVEMRHLDRDSSNSSNADTL